MQTLFWAAFGLVDLDSFELEGIKIFTRFWGMLMFGTYAVINVIVLLNLLIAMMNHSYQLISVSNAVPLPHSISASSSPMPMIVVHQHHTVRFRRNVPTSNGSLRAASCG